MLQGEEEEVEVHTVWHIGAVETANADEQDETTKDIGAINIGGTVEKMQGCLNPGAVPVSIGKVEAMDVDSGTKGNKGKSIKITLDSGAGASCWPEKFWKSIPMNPKTKGVKFSAANGTELKYGGN